MKSKTINNATLFEMVKEQLELGKSVKIPTNGVSMLPFIVGKRDFVVLQKQESYTVGDIVLAKVENGNFVLHRLIKIEGDAYTLMGDGNLYGTEQTSQELIAAKCVEIIRKGKVVKCDTQKMAKQSQLWQKLRPIRKYLLAIYKIVYLR